MQTNCPSEVFHQRFRLLDFSRVDFAADDGTEWNFGAEFSRNCESECCLACSWATSKEDCAARHLFGFDQVHHNTACLDLLAMDSE